MDEKKTVLKPGLYVTATPIGNLADMTYRAVDTLKNVDVILCEDTRHTAGLCAAYGISTRRLAYHEHNARRVRPRIMERLAAGASMALVSDAGTPLIADPGFRLVHEARSAGIDVFPVPGACALTAALSAGGLPTDRFFFAGFLSPRTAGRCMMLETLKDTRAVLVFYETAVRLAASLADMHAVLGPRRAVLAGEMTKRFERFHRGTLEELARHYRENRIKGELVVMVSPPGSSAPDKGTIDAFIRESLPAMTLKDISLEGARIFGTGRRKVYERALEIRKGTEKGKGTQG